VTNPEGLSGRSTHHGRQLQALGVVHHRAADGQGHGEGDSPAQFEVVRGKCVGEDTGQLRRNSWAFGRTKEGRIEWAAVSKLGPSAKLKLSTHLVGPLSPFSFCCWPPIVVSNLAGPPPSRLSIGPSDPPAGNHANARARPRLSPPRRPPAALPLLWWESFRCSMGKSIRTDGKVGKVWFG